MPSDDDSVFSELDDDSATVIADGDSDIVNGQSKTLDRLTFVKDGSCIWVKFRDGEVLDGFCIATCRGELYELLKGGDFKTMRFDLTGVPYLPSGMLGVLISIKKRGVDVEVFNANETIRDTFEVIHLDSQIRICDGID